MSQDQRFRSDYGDERQCSECSYPLRSDANKTLYRLTR